LNGSENSTASKFDLPVVDATTKVRLTDNETFLFRLDLILEETTEMLRDHRKGDVAKTADAIGDLLYVTYGLAHYMGLPIDQIFAEIHRANMSKERSTGNGDARSTRGSAIDVVKPLDFVPPNIQRIIDAHS